MSPDADSFRALARSAPWRWRTLHLRHRGSASRGAWVEAWLARPDRLLVRDSDGDGRHDGWPYGTSPEVPMVWPTTREPVLRPDGLVAVRDDDPGVRWGDPMYGDYRWVAMLDPVELSHHVEVGDVRAGERAGRATWEARLRPLAGYRPRCGCCPLLRSEISERDEYGDGDPAWRPSAGASYPVAYDVALDLGTGVVVRVEPVGGGRDDDRLESRILEVDADLDAILG